MTLNELFNQVPHYLILFHEDYADDFAMKDSPKFNPEYSKIVGTFEGKDIWASRYYPGCHVFGIIDDEHLQSFIIIEDKLINGCHPLIRIWTKGGKTTAGYVTALVLFVLRKLQLKLIIKDKEPLTTYGTNWLVRLIQRKTITAIDANTKIPIIPDDIITNVSLAKDTQHPTSLAIILEGEKFDYPLFSKGYRTLWEMRQIIGSEDLL